MLAESYLTEYMDEIMKNLMNEKGYFVFPVPAILFDDTVQESGKFRLLKISNLHTVGI